MKNDYLTEKKPLSALIVFALPIIIGNLFQQTYTMTAIGNAMSSYTAQNIGAKKEDRIVMGYHAANKMVIFCAIVICLALELFHSQIIAFFLGSQGTETAVATDNDYLVFMGWFFCLIGFKMAVDGLLRGAGDMKMFTIANLANLFFRVAASMTLAPVFGVQMVWITVPAGWLINWGISPSFSNKSANSLSRFT